MILFNIKVLFSITWVLLSIISIFYGIYHCRSSSYNYTIQCDSTTCNWKKYDKGILDELSFSRYDFVDAESVRINYQGEFVDSQTVQKNRNIRFGHSVRLRLRIPAEPGSKIKIERLLVLSPYDMVSFHPIVVFAIFFNSIRSTHTKGRRSSRSAHSRLQSYLSRTKESVTVNASMSVTFVGLISAIFGLVSLILSCIFGEWADKPKRRVNRKAS